MYGYNPLSPGDSLYDLWDELHPALQLLLE